MKLISFENLGNTCYINSVLQCFIYNQCLSKTDIPFLKDLTFDLTSKEHINQITNPKEFIKYFFKKNCQFKPFQQNDAHEFMMSFINLLLESPGLPRKSRLPVFLKNNNYSPFVEEFYGQTKLNIVCKKCQTKKKVYEEFNSIHLVPKKKNITDLLLDYLSLEVHNDTENMYFCDRCNTNTITEQKLKLTVLPRTLILVIKETNETIEYQQKLYIRDQSHIKKYNLSSFVIHQGTLENGHYTVCVIIKDTWFMINDSHISIIDPCYNLTGVYILFYSSE